MRTRVVLPALAASVALLGGCAYGGPTYSTGPAGSARIVTVIPTTQMTSNEEVARAEQALASAADLGANQTHPLLMARARDHLGKAKAAWLYAYNEVGQDDLEPEDEEYIAALRLSQKALADAEVALAKAQTTRNEQRLAGLKQSTEVLRNELKRAMDVETGAAK